jgi:hypothetical protein
MKTQNHIECSGFFGYNLYMRDYLDEDFWKLLFGFIAIISISMIIVLATRVYSESRSSRAITASILNSF